MYDVVILGTVNEKSYLPDHRISFAVLLTGFALIALVPYTRNVINNLKPIKIIERFDNIDKESIKKIINKSL